MEYVDDQVEEFNKSEYPDLDGNINQEETNDNSRILYITLLIIAGIFILWVCILLFSQDDIVSILLEMHNLDTNLHPIV